MKKNAYKKAAKNFKPQIFFIFLFIITLAICFKLSLEFLRSSEIFRIRKITYPKAINIPMNNDIFDLIGKNLFSLNLEKITNNIKQEFPQLSKVRILRRLPDEVVIEAQKRNPVASVNLANKYFYVDSEAAISSVSNIQNNLPVILGVVNRPASLRVGQIYDDRNLRFALEIIQGIDKIPYLKKLLILFKGYRRMLIMKKWNNCFANIFRSGTPDTHKNLNDEIVLIPEVIKKLGLNIVSRNNKTHSKNLSIPIE